MTASGFLKMLKRAAASQWSSKKPGNNPAGIPTWCSASRARVAPCDRRLSRTS